jgi:acyl-CoA dehydrogenase
MTFTYTAEQQAFQTRVRQVASSHVAPAGIDQRGSIPDDVVRALAEAGVWPAPDVVSAVIVAEELAAASAAVAAEVTLTGQIAGAPDLPGLRGFHGRAAGAPVALARVAVAGVAIGIARAALAEAVDRARAEGARPKGTEQTPHWVLADAATGIDAAHLLTLHAAQAVARGEDANAPAAMAQFSANAAAARAVDAALRIIGPEGYRQGTVLERLARDQRTTALLTGTEEEPREVAAAGLLPE